jgi:hypothetical protein
MESHSLKRALDVPLCPCGKRSSEIEGLCTPCDRKRQDLLGKKRVVLCCGSILDQNLVDFCKDYYFRGTRSCRSHCRMVEQIYVKNRINCTKLSKYWTVSKPRGFQPRFDKISD